MILNFKKQFIYFIGAFIIILAVFYCYYHFILLPKEQAVKIEAQNKLNENTTKLKAEFLAECKIDADKMYNNFANQEYLKEQSDQAKQDCYNGNYSFSPDSPFQCYPNLKDQTGREGLLVALTNEAYLDACIKYNMDLVTP